MARQYLIINDKDGGAPVYLEVSNVAGVYVITGISVSGLGLSTAGVADALNKRFVTDAELTAIQALTNNAEERLLATVANINLNTAVPTALYTVPAAKSCIPTKLVFRGASISLNTAKWSVGFTGAAFNDVIADAIHSELTGSSLFTILNPKAGAKIGAAAGVLTLQVNTLQGVAATINCDVYGYLF